jgi:parvulin-like peptidyl-prolyl isomerase
MKIKRNVVYLIFLVPILFLIGCGSKDLKVVARVGNEMITIADFEKAYLKAKPVQMAQNASLDEKKKFLDQLVEQKMQLQSAYQNKIDQDPGIEERIKKIKEQILYLAALDDEIVYKLIKEEEIREHYDKSKLEFRARQILIIIPQNASQQQLDSTRTLAKEIIQEIRSGSDFSQMAEKYSEDPSSNKKGGDLGFVRWGRLEDQLQRKLFKMRKYELTTEPIKTSKGYHVLQVTDRKVLPQKPYELEKEKIVQNLFRKYRTELIEKYNEFNKELERKRKVVYHDELIDSVITHFKIPENDSIYRGNVMIGNPIRNYDWMGPKVLKTGFAVYDKGIINAADVVNFMLDQGNPVPIRMKSDIRKIVENILYVRLTLDIGYQRGYLKKSPYKENYEKELIQILSASLRNQQVNSKLDMGDDKLKEYYTNNKESFKEAARTEVQEILVEEEDLANKIINWANSGQNFDMLAEKYNTRSTSKNKKGVLGKITENSYGIIGKKAFEIEVGEIKGPFKSGKKFSIIKVLSRDEERIKTFEEARNEVQSKLRRELVNTFESEWKEKMQKQISIRVFPENLEFAFKDIS